MSHNDSYKPKPEMFEWAITWARLNAESQIFIAMLLDIESNSPPHFIEKYEVPVGYTNSDGHFLYYNMSLHVTDILSRPRKKRYKVTMILKRWNGNMLWSITIKLLRLIRLTLYITVTKRKFLFA